MVTRRTIDYHPREPMDRSLLPYRPDRDVYRLLGVHPSAGRAEIVAACRRLARAFHPDRNESQRANEEMQVVNAVRSVMTDPAARAEYDHARAVFLAAKRGSFKKAVAIERAPTVAVKVSAGRAELSKAARAAMAGLVVAWRTLAPPRCAKCEAWADPDDRFCGQCGSPLRATQPVSAD